MKDKDISLDTISNAISKHFDIPKYLMFSKTRKEDIVFARQWFQYLARRLKPNYTNVKIGAYYYEETKVKKDNPTVIHSFKVISGFLDISRVERQREVDLLYEINSLHDSLCYDQEKYKGFCVPCETFNEKSIIN